MRSSVKAGSIRPFRSVRSNIHPTWIGQTFLQLVLLSIIRVGQNVLAAAGDKPTKVGVAGSDPSSSEARWTLRNSCGARGRSTSP